MALSDKVHIESPDGNETTYFDVNGSINQTTEFSLTREALAAAASKIAGTEVQISNDDVSFDFNVSDANIEENWFPNRSEVDNSNHINTRYRRTLHVICRDYNLEGRSKLYWNGQVFEGIISNVDTQESAGNQNKQRETYTGSFEFTIIDVLK